jgi:hypothetical protein
MPERHSLVPRYTASNGALSNWILTIRLRYPLAINMRTYSGFLVSRALQDADVCQLQQNKTIVLIHFNGKRKSLSFVCSRPHPGMQPWLFGLCGHVTEDKEPL